MRISSCTNGGAAISKILVIDDNSEIRALSRATLEDEGHVVALAATGDDGIQAFEVERPDCILLDVRMPGMDGFAVCERIRQMPGGEDTPIVFLTASRDVDTFDRALQAGADDFLTKPVRPSELLIRVQAAIKLRRMSAELREHYEIVRRQRDELMRLQLQKELLTAFVVHDLKNPVSSMDLHAQVVLLDRDLSPRSRESIQHIRGDARALLRLILNLLDISKSEQGRLVATRGEVDLEALSFEVLEAMTVKARATEVTLAHAIEVRRVAADGDLLRRVIENLLDNAIRHAPDATTIRLSVAAPAGDLELRVADSGPGIPPAMRERIFERFVQVESDDPTASRTGRGLGLAFCKLAVEAHGGRIWVEDNNPGTVFCVSLPDACHA